MSGRMRSTLASLITGHRRQACHNNCREVLRFLPWSSSRILSDSVVVVASDEMDAIIELRRIHFLNQVGVDITPTWPVWVGRLVWLVRNGSKCCPPQCLYVLCEILTTLLQRRRLFTRMTPNGCADRKMHRSAYLLHEVIVLLRALKGLFKSSAVSGWARYMLLIFEYINVNII